MSFWQLIGRQSNWLTYHEVGIRLAYEWDRVIENEINVWMIKLIYKEELEPGYCNTILNIVFMHTDKITV